MTAFDLLSLAHERGLKLEARGENLLVKPNRLLTPSFAGTLREFKPALLPLLETRGKTWVEEYSERLGETIFVCENEATKAALVEAGADEWSIYTKGELRVLIDNNRAKPFLPDELCKVHEIKRTFNGKITK
jgi:hypothetical protein